jgi:hypothetical protein
MELSDEELAALGRSLRAWPPPSLEDFSTCNRDSGQSQFAPLASTEVMAGSLYRCADELALPTTAEGWSNRTILDFFRTQQGKILAFASGLHGRLGAESSVALLDEQAVLLVADALMGGWRLQLQWQREALESSKH